MAEESEDGCESDFQAGGMADTRHHHEYRSPVRQYKRMLNGSVRKSVLVQICLLVTKTSRLSSPTYLQKKAGGEVFEIDLQIAPRDVHLDRRGGGAGMWKVNEKAKKRAEVSFRKLEDKDKIHFMQAMKSELGSYLEREAVEIALQNDIPKEWVLPMRWVLTLKSVEDETGHEVGKKPKARLIIKGFMDPDLLHLKRESPTLSTQNRNLLLPVAAQRRWKTQVGTLKRPSLRLSSCKWAGGSCLMRVKTLLD